MNINHLEKLKAEIEKNHEANIAAIEQLLGKMRESSTMPTSLIQTVRPKTRPRNQIVEEIIKDSKSDFDIYDICLKFEKVTGEQPSRRVSLTVSQVINKLRQRNPTEIDVVKEGKGSRSGIYRLKTN